MSDPSPLSPALGLEPRDDLAPALARQPSWRDHANLPPFFVPEDELRIAFDPALCGYEGLKHEVVYYVNVVRFFKADPETCCANFRSYGTGARISPAMVRSLDEWSLLKSILAMPYPADYFGPTPYANHPGGAKPPVVASWVRVRPEEWVLPPRTKFPGRAALRKAPTATLVWLAGEAIAEHQRYRVFGKRSYRNLGPTILANLVDEFQVRGPEAQAALLGLLDHEDTFVRYRVAELAFALGEPERAWDVLEALAADPSLTVQRFAATWCKDGRRDMAPWSFHSLS